ncbi:hypothetical protein LTR86_008442 [Recurvomyces mirabilis]|nr:hypothetical protein LTR86_008442 [Recurvomyces mirabilis]
MFAPIYRPIRGKSTVPSKRRQVRKHNDDSSEDEVIDLKSSPPPESAPGPSQSIFYHAINRTDPYHVAGLSREDALPPAPFPHAATKAAKQLPLIEEEFANLNPPLYVPITAAEDHSQSLQRRHIDNLTTLLHSCMLRGDWERASRAWGLLLRTEVAGRGMDVRQGGRWGIGAELLMRRKAVSDQQTKPSVSSATPEEEDSIQESDTVNSPFSDEGFRLAREYYERLILQYPYTQYTRHTVNAQVFYPALLNIWVYEVQDRSKRRRRARTEQDHSLLSSSQTSDDGSHSGDRRHVHEARNKELEEALPIAQRMDELMVSPPYDSSVALLHLRGMVGLWVADLHASIADAAETEGESSDYGVDGVVDNAEAQRCRDRFDAEHRKAFVWLRKAKAAGSRLPSNIDMLLDADDGGG